MDQYYTNLIITTNQLNGNTFNNKGYIIQAEDLVYASTQDYSQVATTKQGQLLVKEQQHWVLNLERDHLKMKVI